MSLAGLTMLMFAVSRGPLSSAVDPLALTLATPPAWLRQWGSNGGGDGQFDHPAGIAVNAKGDVYVADRYVPRIQTFTSEGKYLAQWGSFGQGEGQFHAPFGVAVDANGQVYVTDISLHRIQKFTRDGKCL